MKIAVVGSGISGLASAWLLSRNHEVHLFEAGSRLGGHARTVSSDGMPMDIGFLVYNELTYPRLTKLFKALSVETLESDMSLSIQSKHKNLEWNGTDLNSVFGQRRNLLRPSFYRMLLEIVRFHKNAEIYLQDSIKNSWTLRELLRAKGYSEQFYGDYMIPMGAAIWSTPEEKILDFPASTFLNFCLNHRLLQVNGRPVWRTVKNGSQEYVQKISKPVSKIFLNSPVEQIERQEGFVKLRANGELLRYDKVVLATHAPTTYQILHSKSDREAQVLSKFRYQMNTVDLHSEITVMPKHRRCWASWNVQAKNQSVENQEVELSYYLNKLQPWLAGRNFFATLNAKSNLERPILSENFEHPVFDAAAIKAQSEVKSIQGSGGVYYAGAWMGYGFHEDGLKSATEVSAMLGSIPPWEVI